MPKRHVDRIRVCHHAHVLKPVLQLAVLRGCDGADQRRHGYDGAATRVVRLRTSVSDSLMAKGKLSLRTRSNSDAIIFQPSSGTGAQMPTACSVSSFA